MLSDWRELAEFLNSSATFLSFFIIVNDESRTKCCLDGGEETFAPLFLSLVKLQTIDTGFLVDIILSHSSTHTNEH